MKPPQLLITGLAGAASNCYSRVSEDRYRFVDGIAPSDAAVSSAQESLRMLGLRPSDFDFVISSTQTPDFNNPGLVSLLLHKLGAMSVGGMEVRHLNCGALVALDLAVKLVSCEENKLILVSACDALSRFFPATMSAEKEMPGVHTAHQVFADAAATLVVASADQLSPGTAPVFEFLGSMLGAKGAQVEDFCCRLPSCSQFPVRLRKEDVEQGLHLPSLHADRFLRSIDGSVGAAFDAFLSSSGLVREQFSLLMTHSVCAGMAEQLRSVLLLPSVAVVDVFPRSGFVGAAGVLLALQQAPLEKGQVGLLATVSSGPSWAFVAVRRV